LGGLALEQDEVPDHDDRGVEEEYMQEMEEGDREATPSTAEGPRHRHGLAVDRPIDLNEQGRVIITVSNRAYVFETLILL
jgi:hypothetical protein